MHAAYTELASEAAQQSGVRDVVIERHAIVDNDLPNSSDVMTGILDAIDSAMETGKTVYVHCLKDGGRTGTTIGCWLVCNGHTGDAALEKIADWWQGVEKSARFLRTPQTDEQHDYVRNWSEPTA